MRKSLDEDDIDNCTFSPKTNKSKIYFIENKKNVYNRLYEDNQRRMRNNHINKHSQDNEFYEMASKQHKKNLNSDHLEKLYNDHNKIKTDRTHKNKHEEDIKMTFKPLSFSEENLKRKNFLNDFLERNEKLIHRKNLYSELYNRMLKESFNNNKVHSLEEVEEIEKYLLERLYEKEIDKIKEKNLKEKVEYKNKFVYEKNLRNNHLNNSPENLKKNLINTPAYGLNLNNLQEENNILINKFKSRPRRNSYNIFNKNESEITQQDDFYKRNKNSEKKTSYNKNKINKNYKTGKFY